MDLTDLRRYAEENGIPIVKPETEKFLRLLTELKRPEKLLEIGTAIGYSGAVLLQSGSRSSKLYSIEIDEQRFFQAKENLKSLGLSERAVLYQGDATEIVPRLTGSYDMIFLDGPKGQYLHFLPYLLGVLEKGGVLVCDNVLYRGLVDGRVEMRRKNLTLVTNLRLFLEALEKDSRLTTQVFNIEDGVSVSVFKG